MEQPPECLWREAIKSLASGAGRAVAGISACVVLGGLIGGAAGLWYGGLMLMLLGLVVGAVAGLCLWLAVWFVIYSV